MEMRNAGRAELVPVIIFIAFMSIIMVTPATESDATDMISAIKGSKHDLSMMGGTYKASGVAAEQLCSFCHTPQIGNSEPANLPLWNRTTSSSGYTMYASPTIDMTIAAQPQGVSALCLSCHDGVVALDERINKTGSSSTGATLNITSALTGNKLNGINNPASFIARNLGDDHPISITYDASKDSKFILPVDGKVGALPLYGEAKDQVECGTCHNVHDPSVAPFLRISNAGSALCLSCHNT